MMDGAKGWRHAGATALSMVLITVMETVNTGGASAVAVGGLCTALTAYLTNAAVKNVKGKPIGGE